LPRHTLSHRGTRGGSEECSNSPLLLARKQGPERQPVGAAVEEHSRDSVHADHPDRREEGRCSFARMVGTMDALITPRGRVGTVPHSTTSPIKAHRMSPKVVLPNDPHAQAVAQLAPGRLVTADNVQLFYNHQILVRTTSSYRTALGSVVDPAAQCVGVVIKINRNQVDKHGNGMRVDVLWDNGRPLQGYRVGYAKAYDLEAAPPREPDENPHSQQPSVSQTATVERRSIWRRLTSGFKSPFPSKRSCRALDPSSTFADDGAVRVSVGFLAAPQVHAPTALDAHHRQDRTGNVSAQHGSVMYPTATKYRAPEAEPQCKPVVSPNAVSPGASGCYKVALTAGRAEDARRPARSPALSPAALSPALVQAGEEHQEVSPFSAFYQQVSMPHGRPCEHRSVTSANPSNETSRSGSPHEMAKPWVLRRD